MTSTPFLELPKSVRLRIYHHAFAAKHISTVTINWFPFPDIYGSERTSTSINLLRTCSQIHREATELMYDDDIMVYLSMDSPPTIFQRPFWRRADYTHHLRRTKHLFIMADVTNALSLDFLEMLRVMRNLKDIRISLGTDGHEDDKLAQVREWIFKLLELVPSHCQVFFGAGDEKSVSRRIIYDRYNYVCTWEDLGGPYQDPWIAVPLESIERILQNAVDFSGTKRKFDSHIKPDLPMSTIEAGVKLSDTVPNYEIWWKSSRSDAANLEQLAYVGRPVQAKFEYLFSLPIELRMRIYDFVLAPEGCIRLHKTSFGLTPPLLDLLLTCKRIYLEARDIPFSSNTFICENFLEGTLVKSIPKVCSRVKRLTILVRLKRGIESLVNQIEKYLPKCSALQHVRLILHDASPRDRIDQPIPPAVYQLAQAIEARGCRLSWGSGTEREREYMTCIMPTEVCRGEIDSESIEAQRVLR